LKIKLSLQNHILPTTHSAARFLFRVFRQSLSCHSWHQQLR